jgi:hypothetical protein
MNTGCALALVGITPFNEFVAVVFPVITFIFANLEVAFAIPVCSLLRSLALAVPYMVVDSCLNDSDDDDDLVGNELIVIEPSHCH